MVALVGKALERRSLVAENANLRRKLAEQFGPGRGSTEEVDNLRISMGRQRAGAHRQRSVRLNKPGGEKIASPSPKELTTLQDKAARIETVFSHLGFTDTEIADIVRRFIETAGKSCS